MIGNRICAIALAAASATICSTPSAFASPFDGNWSVVAQTTQGHCGSIQFGLAINRGRTLLCQWILRRRLPGAVGRQCLPLRVCAGDCSGWPAHRPWRRTPLAISGQRDLGR